MSSHSANTLTFFMTTLFEAMITLGGSPTGVNVPPMFEKITIDIKIGTGFNCITSHKRIVTGVINKTVVTLSRNDENSAVKMHKQLINGQI